MEKIITSDNALVLPEKLSYTAPLYKKGLWFETVQPAYELERDIKSAYVAEAIGERDCPTVAKWAGFVLAGGIIGALTDRFILPPKESFSYDYRMHPELHIWEILWGTVEANRDKLDALFLAAALEWFFPEAHHAPPERPYRRSRFVGDWSSTDTTMQSVGNLRLKALKEGREAISRIPELIAESIQKAALYVPPLLEVAIQTMRKTYMW